MEKKQQKIDAGHRIHVRAKLILFSLLIIRNGERHVRQLK
jgi:hypothetical protein